jgi:hypothetical protein
MFVVMISRIEEGRRLRGRPFWKKNYSKKVEDRRKKGWCSSWWVL